MREISIFEEQCQINNVECDILKLNCSHSPSLQRTFPWTYTSFQSYDRRHTDEMAGEIAKEDYFLSDGQANHKNEVPLRYAKISAIKTYW